MDLAGLIVNMGWIAALCFILGLILVVFEIFVPGFGAPGFIGFVLLVFGIAMTAKNIQEALTLIGIIVVILAIALLITFRSATKGRLAKTLVLSSALKKEAGYSGTDDLGYLYGKQGVTVTVLRPAGTAEIESVKMDVVSEAEFIPQGAAVKVIKVEGRRIVVRQIN